MKKILKTGIYLWVILGMHSLAYSGIGPTKHNLSVSGPGPIKSLDTTEICVFCHTPHHSNPAGPVWNKIDPGSTYTIYESESMDALLLEPPDGSSKLCLSCHDGTIAIGTVLNLPGAFTSGTLNLTDSGSGRLNLEGKLAPSVTGFTSYIGTNLTNDHPVSFVYDTSLSGQDGELVDPASSSYVGEGYTFSLPLDRNLKLQCISCHDPHTDQFPKFLRMPIVQTVDFATEGTDAIICLNCHYKEDVVNGGWIGSVHQDPNSADEIYVSGNYLGMTGAVWENACLTCHDTHSVEGSRKLLREGTDDISEPKEGGSSAMEETCYLCHTDTLNTVLDYNQPSYEVKDIETEFSQTYYMPIITTDQADTLSEVHDIKNASMEEITTENYTPSFGVPNLDVDKRHVECSDCHNPHRIVKNSLFDETGIGTQATHVHDPLGIEPHTNIASGALRGSWGIEPDYSSTSWDAWPAGILYEKRGTPPDPAPFPTLDKEYQLCIKCHSSYAYGDTLPIPGDTGGNTPFGTNDLETYTDQAKEFNPANESYHPVMAATGRTLIDRDITTGNPWFNPFGNVGTQTMYCSDCHGKDTTGAGGNNPSPWGPHGSDNEFLLLGHWDFNTGTVNSTGGISEDLCFKCHDPNVYSYQGTAVGAGVSGFSDGFANLHISSDGLSVNLHMNNIDRVNGMNINCMTCHSGVPHGWKKKGLLVETTDPAPYMTSATSLTLLTDPLPLSGGWSCTDCH